MLRASALPVQTRAWLLLFHLPSRVVASERRLPVRSGAVYFSDANFVIDRDTFEEIFVDSDYETEYNGAIVVDVGAHKGYYGAYVLGKGARHVLSYEPETTNFSYLARGSETFGEGDRRWTVELAAVGSEDGEATFYVSTSSWSHSLIPRPNKGARRVSRVERVRVVAMARVLELATTYGRGRLIVKIDAEGAECEIVRGTPTGAWAAVDEIFVETHPFAPCAPDDLLDHLMQAGLYVVERGPVMHLQRES